MIFTFFANYLVAQEIQSTYKFKREEAKKLFNYYELDSLVLYKNGSFYRKEFYQYHQIKYLEHKGDWKIENGILYLNITDKKTSKTEKSWQKSTENYKYKVKKKKLIPVNDSFDIYALRKLKKVTN